MRDTAYNCDPFESQESPNIPRLTKSQKRVLTILAEHSSEGVARMSYGQIAKAAGISSKTAQRAVEHLIDAKIIARAAKGNGRGNAASYRLEKVDISVAQKVDKGGHLSTFKGGQRWTNVHLSRARVPYVGSSEPKGSSSPTSDSSLRSESEVVVAQARETTTKTDLAIVDEILAEISVPQHSKHLQTWMLIGAQRVAEWRRQGATDQILSFAAKRAAENLRSRGETLGCHPNYLDGIVGDLVATATAPIPAINGATHVGRADQSSRASWGPRSGFADERPTSIAGFAARVLRERQG